VGEGERLHSCKKLTENLGLDEMVEFKGLCNNVSELLKRADIFVSFSKAEGLSNSLLEAQSSGLPVVASDIPSHREAINPTAHCFLFPRRDIRMGAENIIRILSDQELYGKLSDAGRDFVVANYDAKAALKDLEKKYLEWIKEVK